MEIIVKMEGLPPEIFVEILSKLDSVSLVRARSISVIWRDFCDILIGRRIELQRDNVGFCAQCLKPLIFGEISDCCWMDCYDDFCDSCRVYFRNCYNCGESYCNVHSNLRHPKIQCCYCNMIR